MHVNFGVASAMSLKNSDSASALLQVLDETVRKSLVNDLRRYLLPCRRPPNVIRRLERGSYP